MLRTNVKRKRRDLGLGSARYLTLSQARDRAGALRKVARDGRDPTTERKQSITFAEAAKPVHAERVKGFSNGKHKEPWINTLNTYAVPVIGKKLVSEVEPDDVR